MSLCPKKNYRNDDVYFESIDDFKQNAVFSCVGGGRCFSKDEELPIVFDNELLEKIRIAEIINTEDEDLNNFIEDFCEKHKLKSLFVSITNQEDDNLWGEIIGTGEPLPYHFEIKDVACFY